MNKLIFAIITACTLLLTACNSENEGELNPINKNITNTAVLRLEGSIQHFDGDAGTRATTSDWANGAKLYIQYQTAGGMVSGVATYSESSDEWTVSYYGSITRNEKTPCEVYYFENPNVSSSSSVGLSYLSAVFCDSNASYVFKDGIVYLRANLKPKTGRIRFRGNAGYSFLVKGLSWHNNYNISTNNISQQSKEFSLTIGPDGFSPYIYATFEEELTRQIAIAIEGNNDFIFLKDFDEPVLSIGKSGYTNVPTLESRNGWQLYEYRKNFSLDIHGIQVFFRMIRVDAGSFWMGRVNYTDIEPHSHKVTLTKDYFIGETEVTQDLWYSIMGQSPMSDGPQWVSTYGIGGSFPAYYISYNDCLLFLQNLSEITGMLFRLPTEAEWEFAARGGNMGNGTGSYLYSGSYYISEVAWYKENSGGCTHEVKTKKPNQLGLYDMSGNVLEWCADRFSSYREEEEIDPTGPSWPTVFVSRGGDWTDPKENCCVAKRYNGSPNHRLNNLGVRLAL